MKSQHICLLLFLVLVLFLFPIIAATKEKEPAWNQTDFWFRDDDGAEDSATGYSSPDIDEDTNITNVAPGTVFRLRFGIRVTDADGTLVPRFEFKQGTDCTTGDWTVITPTSDTFSLRLSDNFSDGDPTTDQITGGSFVAGQILESTNPAPSLDLVKNKYTEYEWSLKTAEDIALETIYSFRITNNGTALDNYELCPSLTTQSESEPEPEPVGRGAVRRQRVTVFSGQAYPYSKIEVMFKGSADAPYNEVPVAEYYMSSYGAFRVAYVGLIDIALSGEEYFLGLRAEDKDNRKTGIKPFNVGTLSSQLFFKIFMPPTVGFLRGTVRKGDFLTVMGYAEPRSVIEIEIDDELMEKRVEADEGGFYKTSIGTTELSFGEHTIRTRQKQSSKVSDFSLKKIFVVSKLFSPKTDFNNDDKIDISDLSIFLSRWKSENEEEKRQIDFNENGKVDVSDFSIFLRTVKK